MFTRKSVARILLSLGFVAAFILTENLTHKKTEGFACLKIASSLRHHPDWDIAPLKEEERTLLATEVFTQPYSYLARGAQAFAFLSADGKYVIKFFRLYRITPPFWTANWRWPFSLQIYRLARMENRYKKTHKDFSSYKLAFDALRSETGLLWVHLNKSSDWKQQLTIRDKMGITHQLDLDDTAFVVQRYADLFYPKLETCIQKNNLKEAEKILDGVVELLLKRIHARIYDKDPNLTKNFGVLDGAVVEIDVGRFDRDKELDGTPKEEILRITHHLFEWLWDAQPDLAKYLERRIDQV